MPFKKIKISTFTPKMFVFFKITFFRMSSSEAAKAENTRKADRFISLPKLWDSIPVVGPAGDTMMDRFGWISNCSIRENRENPPVEFKNP